MNKFLSISHQRSIRKMQDKLVNMHKALNINSENSGIYP